MKKWGIVVAILVIMVGVLKLRPAIYNLRNPASVVEHFLGSCKNALSSFQPDVKYNRVKYKEALEKYSNGQIESAQNKFVSTEDYLAYIDTIIDEENISLANYLMKQKGLKSFYHKQMIDSTREDKLTRFILRGSLENYISKSVKIKSITQSKSFALERLIRDRLTSEALKKLSDGEASDLSIVLKYGLELLSYSPVIFGMPPLKLPNFRLDAERSLFQIKDITELKNAYYALSREDQGLLNLKKKYEVFRKYYSYTISGFYLYITYEQINDVNKEEKTLRDVNGVLDDTITELKELSRPSCESVYKCLKDFKSDWEGQSDEVYIEYKNICKDVYEVPEDC